MCVCVCARAGVRTKCVCVGRGSVGVCVRVRARSFADAVCKAYVPYCDVNCDLWLYHMFRHYLITGKIFGKNLLNIKCVSIFSTAFV